MKNTQQEKFYICIVLFGGGMPFLFRRNLHYLDMHNFERPSLEAMLMSLVSIFRDAAQISSLISTICHINQFLFASYLF